MGDDTFRHEYLSAWYEPTEREKFLWSLAEQYHNRTEAYDRTVCTGPIRRGAILPSGPYELGLVHTHACKVKTELVEQAALRGIPAENVLEAIRQFTERQR